MKKSHFALQPKKKKSQIEAQIGQPKHKSSFAGEVAGQPKHKSKHRSAAIFDRIKLTAAAVGFTERGKREEERFYMKLFSRKLKICHLQFLGQNSRYLRTVRNDRNQPVLVGIEDGYYKVRLPFLFKSGTYRPVRYEIHNLVC